MGTTSSEPLPLLWHCTIPPLQKKSGGRVTVTVDQLVDRWEAKKAEWARLHVQVDGAALADEVLRDLASLSDSEPAVSLAAAAARTGYTADHLSRLIKAGSLTNYGRKHAPRVRLSECPTKPALTRPPAYPYNPDADARSLGARR